MNRQAIEREKSRERAQIIKQSALTLLEQRASITTAEVIQYMENESVGPTGYLSMYEKGRLRSQVPKVLGELADEGLLAKSKRGRGFNIPCFKLPT